MGVQDTYLLVRMVVFNKYDKRLLLACEQPFSCCANKADAEDGYLGCGGASVDKQPGKCLCYGLAMDSSPSCRPFGQLRGSQSSHSRRAVVAEPLWSR